MAETNYRPTGSRMHEHTEGILDQVSDMGDRAGTIASEFATAIKERPYTTMAIAAGLAFTVGALWKLGQRGRPQSRIDAWRAQLPEFPSRERLENLLPHRWR